MNSKENPHCVLNAAAVTIVTNPYNPYRSHLENMKLEATLWLKCGYYPHNLDYLLLRIESGLCGLFKPKIIWIEPHFITRDGMKDIIFCHFEAFNTP